MSVDRWMTTLLGQHSGIWSARAWRGCRLEKTVGEERVGSDVLVEATLSRVGAGTVDVPAII